MLTIPRDNRAVARPTALCAAVLLLFAGPVSGQDSCRLCYGDPGAAEGERPLTIEIWADLNFSRLAMTGRDGGGVMLDPATGTKSTFGEMSDLGGMAVTGHGRITGAPLREVRIELPEQVAMTTADGGRGEMVQFTTDLPQHPVLDAQGRLEFRFGAKLIVRGGRAGNFRGRIPISVDYN